MVADHMIEAFKSLTMRGCLKKCALEIKCESMNFHRYSGDCELLDSPTLVKKHLLIKKPGWDVYEPNPANRNVGCFTIHLFLIFYNEIKKLNTRLKFHNF